MLSEGIFDPAAETYDQTFTRSLTGKAQRSIVTNYIRRKIPAGSDVLEINCGTGEDALFLAKMGCRVTATDASAVMIRKATEKKLAAGMGANPEFMQVEFSQLESVFGDRQFDVIFSNFSGLNCISPEMMKEMSVVFKKLLKPGGRMIIVLFGEKCLSERMYFLLKGKRKGRRKPGKAVPATIGNSSFDIWYYPAKEIRTIFKDNFTFKERKPVGFIIPPAYLDNLFSGRMMLFYFMMTTERFFSRFSIFSAYSDHYIIEFMKK